MKLTIELPDLEEGYRYLLNEVGIPTYRVPLMGEHYLASLEGGVACECVESHVDGATPRFILLKKRPFQFGDLVQNKETGVAYFVYAAKEFRPLRLATCSCFIIMSPEEVKLVSEADEDSIAETIKLLNGGAE